jgi:hypothetical protein
MEKKRKFEDEIATDSQSVIREQKSDQDLLDSQINKKSQLEETFKKHSNEKRKPSSERRN